MLQVTMFTVNKEAYYMLLTVCLKIKRYVTGNLMFSLYTSKWEGMLHITKYFHRTLVNKEVGYMLLNVLTVCLEIKWYVTGN